MEELDDIVTLLRRYLAGSLTESERGRLEKWSAEHRANKALLESLSDEQSLFAGFTNYLEVYDEAVSSRLLQIEDRLMSSILPSSTDKDNPRRPLFRWLPYAAALLIGIVTVVWYVFDNQPNEESEIVSLQSTDIPPGGNRATLTLADGRTIMLDETRNGIIIGSGEITYNDGNPLAAVDEAGLEALTLELTTPKGGTYQITLSDGTEVWLNSASTLKYPSRFDGGERVVELEGEAYFDVRSVSSAFQPFQVISNGQTIEVLGTEFNISAYPDSETKTTLVKGSVQVVLVNGHSLPTTLMPGQQSTLHDGTILVSEVDVAPFVAWKSGMFHFKHTLFEDMMVQIERWYDVDVVYSSRVPRETFSGRMRRDVSLLTVLDLLKASEISFHLAGNKLIIE